MPKITNAVRKEIAKIAKIMPKIDVEAGTPVMRGITGSHAIDNGFTKEIEVTSNTGETHRREVRPGDKLIFSTEEAHKVNHKRRMLRAYEIGGWAAVVTYQKNIVKTLKDKYPKDSEQIDAKVAE